MASADIKTIAKACDVSTATISRVFNNRSGVSEKLREKVIQIARELGYAPKQIAAQHDVIIIMDQSDNITGGGYSFRSNILSKILYTFLRNEISVKIIDVQQADLLLPSIAKAALVFVRGDRLHQYTNNLLATNIPIISINAIINGAYSVCSDHFQGAVMAIEHLVNAERKNIGLVVDNPLSWASLERIRAYNQILSHHNLKPLSVQGIEGGVSVIEALANLRNAGADALFIGGESIIEECVYMLGMLGVAIPHDMSIVSCEKVRVSQWFNPPHTTIFQSVDNLCNDIVDLIKAIISGSSTEMHRTIPSILIERSSVKFSK